MKALVFDTGPIINLVVNNLLNILEPLKEKFGGDFLISEDVKRELIDTPLQNKKFEFEALQILQCIKNKTIQVYSSNEVKEKANHLWNLANNCFYAHNHNIQIVHDGEMEAIALASILNTNMVMDERTTRILIENPSRLKDIMKSKLHTKINVNFKNVDLFRDEVKNVKIFRSVELVSIAYELGILDHYIVPEIENSRKILLDSVLWALKLNGCAVSSDEIEKIIEIET